MSKDKNWSDLTKKEKDNAKATAAAAGCLIFWHSLTKAGKWSVARWWLGYYLLAIIDARLFTNINLLGIITLPYFLYGVAILIIFREKIFK